MGELKTIAVIDDEKAMRFALKRALGKEYEVREAEDGQTGLNVIERDRPALVLLDINMPGMNGLEVLGRIRERDEPPPVIILTAHGSERVAVEAMKKGAYDYLPKPYDIDELRIVCRRALDHSGLAAENARLKEALKAGSGQGELLGASEGMRRVRALVERVGPLDATVLIQGESGTGKEVVARALHNRSPRRGGPFVAVNCAALPEGLVESELFGHERGAFTGALATRAGRFEAAKGGTLFLDEIGEAPPALQAKLLRVLETRRFERVGGAEALDADVRLIAATNRDLKERVKQGEFREDLYYRLKVIDLDLPALRQREGDVLLLARRFLEVAALRYGLPVRALSKASAVALGRYSFPGNVRELLNIMEKAAILSSGRLVRLGDLPIEVIEEAGEVTASPDDEPEEGVDPLSGVAGSAGAAGDDLDDADADDGDDADDADDAGAMGDAASASHYASGGGPAATARAPRAAALAADVADAEREALALLDGNALSFADAKKKAMERFEARLLTRELARHRGNVSKTARALGLHRQSLQNKLRELSIDAAHYRG